ncbi:AAA family ATPase [Klebsiella pneumoniae]|nr:AAA family ATPase [Klebsiella pneumoniae]
MTTERNKITLPIIKQVRLYDFDLYTSNPNIITEVNKNVYCLIGANGLGKSTFLNSVTYCITGAIPLTEKNFSTAPEYAKNATRNTRTTDYFNGRISESLRGRVKVSVLLECKNTRIEVVRHLFSDGKVSSLSIENLGNNNHTTLNLNNSNAEEMESLYQQKIIELTGLKDFSQYIFLFHFISVFDESRHLLLWNDDILTNALYIAFGTDPSVAILAENLQNEMEKEDSRGRNAKFAAKQITRQIDELLSAMRDKHSDDGLSQAQTLERHKKLCENVKYAQNRTAHINLEKKDLEVKCAELNSKYSALEVEYRKEFSSRLSNMSHLRYHPLIKLSIEDHKCALCNSESHDISHHLEDIISENKCPLCLSKVIDDSDADKLALQKIKKIDIERANIKEKLEITYQALDRVISELNIAEANEQAAQAELDSFENENRGAILLGSSPNPHYFTQEIKELEAQRDKFNKSSLAFYKKRDELRDQLRKHEKELKVNYSIYAESFVLRFRELAEEFIGMPVDVVLEHHKSKTKSGFGLTLHMNKKLRTTSDKLSESQRFFIDIALRMAITEFMCDGPATLLIDTPEGSLDIAYEARAGSMFSKYAKQNNFILMTANLRSSYLVLRLANLQKKQGMQIVRMTEWTNLTEVQKSEEGLFTRAYNDIEAAME